MQQTIQTGRDPSKNTMALVSMIIGISCIVFGIILWILPFGYVFGSISSLVAVILGIGSLKAENRGFAIVGIATGAFAGLIYASFTLIKLLAFLGIGIFIDLLTLFYEW